MKKLTVIGLGLATVDVIIRLKEMPRWDRAPGFSDFEIQGGGMTGTAMVAASRLGLRAGFLGTAGTDPLGDTKVKFLIDDGVDVRRMVRRQGKEHQIILVYVHEETGERRFSALKGFGSRLLQAAEIDREYVTSADYLFVDGYHFEAARQAAEWMQEAGKTVVMDGGMSGGSRSPEFGGLLEHVDILISGSGFASALTGISDPEKAGIGILKRGPKIYVQTEGPEGCYTVTDEDCFHTPAFSVDVMDTTGAGDTFHGAYLVGLDRGWSLRETALFASAAAAMKCRRLGGRAGIPDRESVLSFLEDRGHSMSRKTGED